MSVTFQELWNELLMSVKIGDHLAAQKFVRRAWRDVRDYREWSFLIEKGVLQIPDAITTGTVTTTQFSPSIVADAAAKSSLDGIGLNIPLSSRQIRIAGGVPYQISAYDSATGTISLDRDFQEASGSGLTYQVLRCYYAPPSTDFIRFISVYDPVSKYYLRHGARYTQKLLDFWDAGRSETSNPPLYIFNYKGGKTVDDLGRTTATFPLYELWPYPTVQRSLPCLYRQRGTDFTDNTDTLPDAIGEDLVLARAKYRAYEYAEANKSNDAGLQKTNWFGLMAAVENEYKTLLKQYVKQDRESFNDRIVTRLPQFRGDADYLQQYEPLTSVYGDWRGNF